MEENLYRLYRKRAGYSQKEIANALHVTTAAVSAWELGKYSPDQQNLSALADLYGVTIDQLLGRVTMIEPANKSSLIEDEVMIPVVASLRCGFGRSGEAIYKEHMPVPRSFIKRWGDDIVYYEATGTSMEPTITPGDLMVVVPGSYWEEGWIVVIDVNDSDTVKRIQRAEDGGIDLIPDNEQYKPMHLSQDDLVSFNVAVLGHVVKSIGPDL